MARQAGGATEAGGDPSHAATIAAGRGRTRRCHRRGRDSQEGARGTACGATTPQTTPTALRATTAAATGRRRTRSGSASRAAVGTRTSTRRFCATVATRGAQTAPCPMDTGAKRTPGRATAPSGIRRRLRGTAARRSASARGVRSGARGKSCTGRRRQAGGPPEVRGGLAKPRPARPHESWRRRSQSPVAKARPKRAGQQAAVGRLPQQPVAGHSQGRPL